MVFLNFYNVPLKESKGLSRMVSCFYCFLQMVIVRQNLHQKVELKRLGLKEGKEKVKEEKARLMGSSASGRGRSLAPTCGLSIWTRLIHPEP